MRKFLKNPWITFFLGSVLAFAISAIPLTMLMNLSATFIELAKYAAFCETCTPDQLATMRAYAENPNLYVLAINQEGVRFIGRHPGKTFGGGPLGYPAEPKVKNGRS